MTTLYDTDCHTWTQQQAQALRAKAWEQLDMEHLAEEIEDLCKSDRHEMAMLLLAFLELIYRPCPDDNGRYYWQSAVIAHHRAMLESSLEDSPRGRPSEPGRSRQGLSGEPAEPGADPRAHGPACG
jgi:hypothetical protein